jgi:hypothetical protein
MNANELRIGNYVDCSKKRHNEKVIKVESICLDCINYDFRGYDVCDLIPIQISKDWLINADFYFDEKRNTYKHEEKNIEIDLSDNMVCISESWEWKEINYVHQLQNLYFSLVGEELVFSTEP